MLNNSKIDISLINAESCLASRKTKVICTLGPACWSVEGLGGLIDAGMNIARFNFSHGDHKSHGASLDRLREAMAARPGCHVGVMLDTKGPEIRTGTLESSLGGKLKLVKGEMIEIGTDYEKPGNNSYLPCSYKSLAKTVVPGMKILCADGSVTFLVKELKVDSVIAQIMNNATIGERKNMNLPGCVVDLPVLTEKDVNDLQQFGLVHKVDFIAASFVRKASDIDLIRGVLGEAGKDIKIIAKIENQEGLENYDEILTKTDAIMVARGDLGMEIPIEKVFLAQKMMIAKANLYGKPVVTATQMLESMITSPRPTRAECADVANAVLDGTDAVMLSGETANGEYPNEAVTCMASTCVEAESMIDYDQAYNNVRDMTLAKWGNLSPEESVASSAVKTARDIGAKMIICLTQTGTTARLISKYRPSQQILLITATDQVAAQCGGYLKNCRCAVAPSFCNNAEALVQFGVQSLKQTGDVKSGDMIVAIHGSANRSFIAGSTRLLQIVTVE